MGNPSYGGVSAASAGARGLAYGVEAYWKQEGIKMDQYRTTFPLLTRIMENGAGMPIEAGPKLLFDVWLANAVTVAGITRANESSTTFTRYYGDGSQGETYKAKYAAFIGVRHEELVNFAKFENKRIDIVKGRKRQVEEAVLQKATTDMFTSQAGAENIVQGIPQVLQTSATVHGIDQSTYTNFAAGYTGSVGTFDQTRADKIIDGLRQIGGFKGNDGVIVCGTGSVDTYQKWRDMLTGLVQVTQPVVDSRGQIVTGHDAFVYRDCEIIREHNMPSGEMYFLDKTTWHWWGDKKPQSLDGGNLNRVDAMLLYEMGWTFECGLFCTAPRFNHRLAGITG